jgi:hypothetical protein
MPIACRYAPAFAKDLHSLVKGVPNWDHKRSQTIFWSKKHVHSITVPTEAGLNSDQQPCFESMTNHWWWQPNQETSNRNLLQFSMHGDILYCAPDMPVTEERKRQIQVSQGHINANRLKGSIYDCVYTEFTLWIPVQTLEPTVFRRSVEDNKHSVST